MVTCTFENGNQNSLRHVTVGCLVLRDDQILLAKRAEGLIEAGKWCLLGGYMERGETAAQTCNREVMEESGWSIRNLRLFRINDNPDRPHEDRQNVDFIYIADAVKQTGEHDWETEELSWFRLNALPSANDFAFDHLDSVELYKKYHFELFDLPVVDAL